MRRARAARTLPSHRHPLSAPDVRLLGLTTKVYAAPSAQGGTRAAPPLLWRAPVRRRAQRDLFEEEGRDESGERDHARRGEGIAEGMRQRRDEDRAHIGR